MKKYLVAALALVCFAGNAMALDNEPQSGVSAQAFFGLSASHINGLKYGPEYNASTGTLQSGSWDGKCGANLGFKIEYTLPGCHGVYINAGLDYIMKGAKYSIDRKFVDENDNVLGTAARNRKYNLHYIELPIHVGFRYNFSKDWGVYGEVGPYFAMGVGGKFKQTVDADGTWTKDFEHSCSAFKKTDDIDMFDPQRWDAGIGFRIGGEYMQHYSLNLGCDWGITDMMRDSKRDLQANWNAAHPNSTEKYPLEKLHNFALTLTFGYRF